MVLHPTTLGDEITFLFCFFFCQPQKKEKLGQGWSCALELEDKIETLM